LGRFVADVTIPDGTVLLTDTKFKKVWRLRNEGTTEWPSDTQLVFVGGDSLSVVVSVPVKAAKPGEEVDVTVDMITPKNGGRFTSFWRLATADGLRFGQRIWVDILVTPPVQPIPPQIPALQIHPAPVKPQIEVPKPSAPPVQQPPQVPQKPSDPFAAAVQQLVQMGFDENRARSTLKSTNGDILSAVQILLQ